MDTYLRIENLTKTYGSLVAVDHLSFSIKKGTVYGLLGPNGSGKSTTLGMILNVINPTQGKFEWFSGQYKPYEALKQIGALIEHPNFYSYMTAVQNLELVCKIKEISTAAIDENLKLVGLYERKDDKFKTYSLGMKQRLAIASALLNDPKVLILDEPTNGLDPQGIHQIREIILKIADNGKTILIASHLLDEIEKICSHVLIIRKGKKLYEGPVEALNASYGYFEIGVEGDSSILSTVLAKHPGIGKINFDSKTNTYTAFLTQETKASMINQYLYEKGIILSHLVKRKESLEKRFLDLTKN